MGLSPGPGLGSVLGFRVSSGVRALGLGPGQEHHSQVCSGGSGVVCFLVESLGWGLVTGAQGWAWELSPGRGLRSQVWGQGLCGQVWVGCSGIKGPESRVQGLGSLLGLGFSSGSGVSFRFGGLGSAKLWGSGLRFGVQGPGTKVWGWGHLQVWVLFRGSQVRVSSRVQGLGRGLGVSSRVKGPGSGLWGRGSGVGAWAWAWD